MANQQEVAQYLLATPADIESLANKLTAFSQTLSQLEQSLFMERIKRSMPVVDVHEDIALAPSPEIFAAWLNSAVPGGSRWFPS